MLWVKIIVQCDVLLAKQEEQVNKQAKQVTKGKKIRPRPIGKEEPGLTDLRDLSDCSAQAKNHLSLGPM